jgi:hypothetical protein
MHQLKNIKKTDWRKGMGTGGGEREKQRRKIGVEVSFLSFFVCVCFLYRRNGHVLNARWKKDLLEFMAGIWEKLLSGTGADSVGKLLKRVGRCEVQFSYN